MDKERLHYLLGDVTAALVVITETLKVTVDELNQALVMINEDTGLAEDFNPTPQRPSDGVKQCATCKRWLPMKDFYIVNGVDSDRPHYKAFCKECERHVGRVNRAYRNGRFVVDTSSSGNAKQLILAWKYLANCKERGGKTDYKWWHVDEFMRKVGLHDGELICDDPNSIIYIQEV